MEKQYKIIDADCHVLEPKQIWTEYLEPEFRDDAPKNYEFAGKPIFNKVSEDLLQATSSIMEQNFSDGGKGGYDPQGRVQVMSDMGVEISFLYPTTGLWMLSIDTMQPELAGALTRAYNNWLRDFCSYDTQKLRGVGAISLHDPQAMITELHRLVKFGWQAIYLRPNPVRGRTLGDRLYEPFWTACERLNIAVAIHEGTHSRLPTTGSDRFSSRFALHACSHPMEQMMAMLALIEGGVMERHPKLRFAFLEAGCGWLPYWLWRLDQEYENLAWEVKQNVKMLPSEYFRRQCFVGIEPSEPYISQLIEFIGTDNLLFGTDYPHIDHNPHIVNDALDLEQTFDRSFLEKIFWHNPRRFYDVK